MFCYQCEQTAKGKGCNKHGVCGKDPETAVLQDCLVHAAKGIAMYAHRARQAEAKDREIDRFILEALFTTVTNVNFDPARIRKALQKAILIRDKARALYEKHHTEPLEGPATWDIQKAIDAPESVAREVAVDARIDEEGEDVTGLKEMTLYGLKGMAAYADHAQILGQEEDAVYAFFHETLDLLTQEGLSADALTAKALEVGKVNIRVMELLDKANTGAYGHPEPTQVRVEPVKGKAILVSGHDLKDLDLLLQQTEGKGVNVYTHGEMLPCNAYPGLKKHKHLIGNYGGAWQDQQKEFEAFPGAILMTTNCIQKPRASYQDRIFTCGLVAWPEVTHIADGDFSPVIECALAQEGFTEDGSDKTIPIGFAHNTVMSVAPTVIDAVKSGAIRHFFLIGGCDGAKPGRNYYTEFAEQVPEDCMILTLACGKFRFNKIDFGDIGGIPRLLDVGQCNDAFSAVKIALTLADAFETDVNGLPLSFILSWYEQKAVVILLSLLYLGIQKIKLGPTLPAFVTPNVLDVLVQNFNIQPIGEVQADLQAALA